MKNVWQLCERRRRSEKSRTQAEAPASSRPPFFLLFFSFLSLPWLEEGKSDLSMTKSFSSFRLSFYHPTFHHFIHSAFLGSSSYSSFVSFLIFLSYEYLKFSKEKWGQAVEWATKRMEIWMNDWKKLKAWSVVNYVMRIKLWLKISVEVEWIEEEEMSKEKKHKKVQKSRCCDYFSFILLSSIACD